MKTSTKKMSGNPESLLRRPGSSKRSANQELDVPVARGSKLDSEVDLGIVGREFAAYGGQAQDVVGHSALGLRRSGA